MASRTWAVVVACALVHSAACGGGNENDGAPAATAQGVAGKAGSAQSAGGPAGGPAGGGAGETQGGAGKPASAGGTQAGAGGQGDGGEGQAGAAGGHDGGAGGQAGGAGGSSTGGSAAGSPSTVCQAGKQEACACPGTTETGVQVCEPSGQSWGPCEGCPSGQGGGAGAGGSSTAGAGGEAGSGGAAGAPECMAGKHQGCECPIAGTFGLQWCTTEGTWGPCEDCPSYPIPVEGTNYNLCEDVGLPSYCTKEDGFFGCVAKIDIQNFAEWREASCSAYVPTAGVFCCNVPSACEKATAGLTNQGAVLTCDEYQAETGVAVSNPKCTEADRPCSVLRPALACPSVCADDEVTLRCLFAEQAVCNFSSPYPDAGEGALLSCCHDI